MSTLTQLCTFTLDGHLFGVDAQMVQEVIRYQEMTQVPLAPPAVTGLINLRGQIVTAIDMRERLGLPSLPAGKLPMNVVIHGDDGVVSLLVDKIGDVVTVDSDRFETPPDTLTGPAKALVLGAYKLEQQLLLLLNCEASVQVVAA